jgi:pectin methylesterase-like acyl-CoA thioesterase
MHKTRRTLLPGILLVAILYSGAAIAATVEVGTCKNGFVQFPTIQAAVTSAPEGATVLVCPGIYPEQVTINKTLTLQGVALSTASGATIAAPSGGVLAITNSLATGDPIAAQVLVQNAEDVDINSIHDNTINGSDESGIHLDGVCTNPDGSGTGKGNKIKDNVINSACAGILVGTLTSIAANSIADNDFFNVGSTILNADGCPAPMAAPQATVRSNAVSGANQGVRLASPVRP